ncbi:MAG: hypothetical protein PHH82_03075 [Candidatus ainarchaeum sp.]|nr:hypothetical protein [Candidatus ainarchaeum sp.]
MGSINQKGNMAVVVILIVVLVLLLVFVFFGKKIGGTDFSIDSVFDNNDSGAGTGTDVSKSLDYNKDVVAQADVNTDINSEPKKASVVGSISGIAESNFSDKEVSFSGETIITRADGTTIKLNNPTVYNFEGTIKAVDTGYELVGTVKKVISDGAEVEFKDQQKVKISVDNLIVKNVKFTLERAGVSGTLVINSYSTVLDKAYINMKNYIGNIELRNDGYYFDGTCDLLTVKQNGQEVSFK